MAADDDTRDETALALIEYLFTRGMLDADDTSNIADFLDSQGFPMKAGYVRAVPFASIGDDLEPPVVLRAIDGGKE